MFHSYVLAYSGTVVDFDRASFLMDKDLLQQSLDAMRHEQATAPRPDANYGAQWVWDYYCQRHWEKFGSRSGRTSSLTGILAAGTPRSVRALPARMQRYPTPEPWLDQTPRLCVGCL
ncbi:MAG TPA: hypothetical protein VI229_04280 [Burkholderiales bacterium]|jgi:hypothetical protein